MSSAGSDLSVPMLNCGLCRSMYRQPRLLACLHSFCTPCLLQLPVLADDLHHTFLRCPQCHRETPLPPGGIPDLTPNDFLARMCQEYVAEVQRTLGTSKSPTELQSPKAGSPSQATSFSYDVQRDSAPYGALSSRSSDTYQNTGRRPSLEMLPLRVKQRRFSVTPPDVLRVWEGLQRKLNSLQSASLQITYGLENINLTESHWYQRKQDLHREVQRRSAQLQFFIKRQERLLLAMLDSKDTDDAFLQAADQARDELRANLKSVVHESEVVKSFLDLAADSELLSMGNVLLSSSASQQPVSMQVPELQFKMPDELSVEDKMGEDFGCFTSTTVTRDIYSPEIVEEDTVEDVQTVSEDRPEEEQDDEMVVTETITYVPSVISQPPPPAVLTPDPVPAEEPAPDHQEDDDQHDDQQTEDEEESEDSEEEVIVEETIEIIDGKMQVISSRRVVPSKPEKEKKERKEKKARKERKERKDESGQRTEKTATATEESRQTRSEQLEVPTSRGRDPHTRRTANSSRSPVPHGPTEHTVPSASASASQTARSVGSHQTAAAQNASAAPSRPTQTKEFGRTRPEARRPTSLTVGTSGQSSLNQAQDLAAARTGEGKAEGKQAAGDSGTTGSGSRTPSEEHQNTLNKFQIFRESLKQRRRELLGASLGPAHVGVAPFLSRERRVQSLDRRAIHRELGPRSPSPELVEVLDVAGGTAAHGSTHPAQSEDPLHGDADLTASHDPPSSGDGDPPHAERNSRPVRRAISAASDKASKMEFLRETWKKRKELLIQKDAYITNVPDSEEGEAGVQEPSGGDLSPDDPHRPRDQPKARSRVTHMNEALIGSRTEPAASKNVPGAGTYPALTRTAAGVVESPAEAQALHTVDKILQKKNVPIPGPRSPNHQPTSPTGSSSNTDSATATATATTTTPAAPWPAKPSMVVRPRPRDPPTPATVVTTTTTFIPTPLETLQEDETKASPQQQQQQQQQQRPQQQRGLRTTSPSRADAGADTLQQVRASIRRKKERWRSLSLT